MVSIKNGSQRFKVDATGCRTNIIDNELLDMAKEYSAGHNQFAVPLTLIYQKDVLVPQYYDRSEERRVGKECRL